VDAASLEEASEAADELGPVGTTSDVVVAAVVSPAEEAVEFDT
jgi:hypothetical protein